LNTQRYIDEILKPIVVPFIRGHHLLFQNDDALPHVARNYTENVPVVPWPAYSPGMSLIEHVWDALFVQNIIVDSLVVYTCLR
jgi:hypothetical protein